MYLVQHSITRMPLSRAPCGLRGCKNGPAPFPGRMSYKVTKPGLVFVLYLSMFFIVLLFIRAPLCRWPSITEWEMYITAQGCRLRNYLYCVEWDVKLYYTIPYHCSSLLTRMKVSVDFIMLDFTLVFMATDNSMMNVSAV